MARSKQHGILIHATQQKDLFLLYDGKTLYTATKDDLLMEKCENMSWGLPVVFMAVEDEKEERAWGARTIMVTKAVATVLRGTVATTVGVEGTGISPVSLSVYRQSEADTTGVEARKKKKQDSSSLWALTRTNEG